MSTENCHCKYCGTAIDLPPESKYERLGKRIERIQQLNKDEMDRLDILKGNMRRNPTQGNIVNVLNSILNIIGPIFDAIREEL